MFTVYKAFLASVHIFYSENNNIIRVKRCHSFCALTWTLFQHDSYFISAKHCDQKSNRLIDVA